MLLLIKKLCFCWQPQLRLTLGMQTATGVIIDVHYLCDVPSAGFRLLFQIHSRCVSCVSLVVVLGQQLTLCMVARLALPAQPV